MIRLVILMHADKSHCIVASQFAELLPLWAKYTIDVAADAPAIKRPNITLKDQRVII